MGYVKEAILNRDEETIQSIGIEAAGMDSQAANPETTIESGWIATEPTDRPLVIDAIITHGETETGQSAGKGRRDERTLNPIITKHKAEVIAEALASGATQKDAMLKAGYKVTTANKGINRLSRVVKQDIQEALEEFRQRKADKVLERSARMNRQADKLMDKIESGEKLEKADIEVLRLSLREGSDLLDRVGAGKINKSMSVRKTVSEDTRTLEQLEARLAELKAKG